MKSIREENKERLEADQKELKIHNEKLRKINQYFWIPGIIFLISITLVIIGAITTDIPLLIVAGVVFVTAFIIAITIGYFSDKESAIVSTYQANVLLGVLTGLMAICIESDLAQKNQEPKPENPPS